MAEVCHEAAGSVSRMDALVNAGLQGRHLGKGLCGCIPLYLDWDASSKKFFKTEPAISI